MSDGVDWLALSRQLTRFRERLDAARQAGLESLDSGNTDPFTQQLAELGPMLAELQAFEPPHGETPGHVLQDLQGVQASMDALLSMSQKMSAQAQRALAVLFPADSVKAYSRLGGRVMGTVGTGSGYLKA